MLDNKLEIAEIVEVSHIKLDSKSIIITDYITRSLISAILIYTIHNIPTISVYHKATRSKK